MVGKWLGFNYVIVVCCLSLFEDSFGVWFFNWFMLGCFLIDVGSWFFECVECMEVEVFVVEVDFGKDMLNVFGIVCIGVLDGFGVVYFVFCFGLLIR